MVASFGRSIRGSLPRLVGHPTAACWPIDGWRNERWEREFTSYRTLTAGPSREKGTIVPRAYTTHRSRRRTRRSQSRSDHTEVVTHGRDGKIRDSDSYGNDPCPPKDTKH